MADLPVDLIATISDLERRVRLLEEVQRGDTQTLMNLPLMARCYLAAHRLPREIDQDFGALWVTSAYRWDARALVALGRHVHDPYPFRPFLAALDLCVLHGIPGAEDARAHLESVGQDVLNAQGLELVRPRDTMGCLRLQEALRRLTRMRK